jgi:hypothetical protein
MKLSVVCFSVLMLVVGVARAETLGSSSTRSYDDSDVAWQSGGEAAHVLRTDADYANAGADSADVIQSRFGGPGGGGGPVMRSGSGGGGLANTGDGFSNTAASREGWPSQSRPEMRPEHRFEGRIDERRDFGGGHFWEHEGYRPNWFRIGFAAAFDLSILSAEILSHHGQVVCRAVPIAGGHVIVQYAPTPQAAQAAIYSGCGMYGNEAACYIPNMAEDCQVIP